jgi:hypothetical protein
LGQIKGGALTQRRQEDFQFADSIDFWRIWAKEAVLSACRSISQRGLAVIAINAMA